MEMSIAQIMEVLHAAVVTEIKVSAPVLLVSMAVGLVISILQAATQIHEQTMTFVPKLIAIAVVLVFLGAWMMETMGDFTKYIFSTIVSLN